MKNKIHLKGDLYKKKYFKLEYNQLLILDTLLESGGNEKKYIDKNNELRYSEHLGVLDFKNSTLQKIIISGKTSREDDDDIEILLPHDLPDINDHEYMFHTHPATPYPGARMKNGILYEFPSISDLYHFAYHYNKGQTNGSLVITPEGIYIINAQNNINKIKYPNNIKIFKKMGLESYKIQSKAIKKYKDNFNQECFYSIISRDPTYLKMFNDVIEKYWGKQIKVTLRPRKFDEKLNKWVLKSLFLPYY